jgi:hypothetical protein
MAKFKTIINTNILSYISKTLYFFKVRVSKRSNSRIKWNVIVIIKYYAYILAYNSQIDDELCKLLVNDYSWARPQNAFIV